LNQVVEVTAPSVDSKDPKVPAMLTIRVVHPELEKELLKLAGPDWERHPLLSIEGEPQPELEPYGLDNLFRVTELNLRPSQPRVAPVAPGPPGGP